MRNEYKVDLWSAEQDGKHLCNFGIFEGAMLALSIGSTLYGHKQSKKARGDINRGLAEANAA